MNALPQYNDPSRFSRIICSFCHLHFPHHLEVEIAHLPAQDVNTRSLYIIFLKGKVDVCGAWSLLCLSGDNFI